MPLTSEELRDKYAVMTNMWMLAQMQKPGRTMYQDLTKDTWNDFLQGLLSTRNFRLEREVAGVRMVVPAWNHCLEHEYQIRKEAVCLSRTQGLPIQAALWRTTASHGTLGDVVVCRESVHLSARPVPGRLPKTPTSVGGDGTEAEAITFSQARRGSWTSPAREPASHRLDPGWQSTGDRSPTSATER